ncbi:hypothetical protein P8452_72577 [Trifolium repens]|nr:hypothetical protein P8452_72577 [Trifolium repens]
MDNLHTSLFLTTTPQPVIPSFIDLYLTKITDDHAPYLKESIIDIVTDFIKLVFCYCEAISSLHQKQQIGGNRSDINAAGVLRQPPETAATNSPSSRTSLGTANRQYY